MAQTLAAEEEDALPIAPQSMDGYGGVPQQPFAASQESAARPLVLGERKMDLRQPASMPPSTEPEEGSEPKEKVPAKKATVVTSKTKKQPAKMTAAKKAATKAKASKSAAKGKKAPGKARVPASKKAKPKK